MTLRVLRHNGVPIAGIPAGAEFLDGCAGCQVRHLSVCSALPLEQARELEAMAGDVTVRAGELLVREGQPRRGVFSVTTGALRRIRLLPDGRRLVAGFLMPGDFIGFSTGPHYRHSIEAIVDSKLCAFPKTDMRALCEQHPALERELLERACLELDATRDNLMSLARMTPLERLAAFLLDMAARRRRHGGSDTEVILPMTRSDIADYLGLTVETVSRSFTRLRQEGVIDTADPHHILLHKRDRLQALAEARG
ncbi:Crp/Fnr family transcriptional regulator [Pseudoxanthomonas mexicana]|uniref:Crp/Fnr family transcriptional regulator n=1 Tax=Pseudoxanthomonas mexicana TaxID=128785 RepID=UPI00398BA3A4